MPLKVSQQFAISEMRSNGENIKKWAAQNNNILLKTLATEVLQAVGEAQK